jgi:hypothetical protein
VNTSYTDYYTEKKKLSLLLERQKKISIEINEHEAIIKWFSEKHILTKTEKSLFYSVPVAPVGKHCIIINHDIHKAFEKEDLDSEYKLPYDQCVFELSLNNRHVCILMPERIAYVKYGDKWHKINLHEYEHLEKYIRAACIALECNIYEKHLIKTKDKVNTKRIQKGMSPFNDYYILTVKQKECKYGEASISRDAKQKRLHFRRGHWRHYPTTKKWIKWQLVGNPDLGFIDKAYKIN